MTNGDIARTLERIALILELKGGENPFRVRAYERAAVSVRNMDKDVRSVYEQGGTKALQQLPSIGKDLAEKIEEMLKTGKLAYLKKQEKGIPAGLITILDIEGMGPKRTKELWDEFGIQSIDDLEKLAQSDELRTRKGWGKKSAEAILRGIAQHRKMRGRLPLPQAEPLARELVRSLQDCGHVQRIEIAGSVRRGKETIGDIDILATSDKPEEVMAYFCTLPQVESVTARGRTKSTVFLRAGMDADLRIVEEGAFGAALLYFTGSKDHNIRIRRLGIVKKRTLSEYGLFAGTPKKKGEKIAAKTEEEVYKAIGLPYIEPELREDTGEVQAAQRGKLPTLVQERDVIADMQMHSVFSDGKTSMADMARAAKTRGLRYIAITDHASPMGMVKGIRNTKKSVQTYLEAIEKARKQVPGIRILAGAEVDILKDGILYLNDELLRQFDWIVATVHQYFHEPRKETTARMIVAIRNPYVHMIGHPTARMLGKRQGIAYDMDTVLETARKHSVAMELNTSPDRLDLSAENLRRAKEKGVRICISSDAHAPQGLQYHYGILQARRAWLEQKDFINMQPWHTFNAWRTKRQASS